MIISRFPLIFWLAFKNFPSDGGSGSAHRLQMHISKIFSIFPKYSRKFPSKFSNNYKFFIDFLIIFEIFRVCKNYKFSISPMYKSTPALLPRPPPSAKYWINYCLSMSIKQGIHKINAHNYTLNAKTDERIRKLEEHVLKNFIEFF